MIFTGDCLFEGGVGMFFEGSAEQMATIYESLFFARVLEADWSNCVLFFGHDYGWKNYNWAAKCLLGQGKTEENKAMHELEEKVT